jgi:hypothetical protein
MLDCRFPIHQCFHVLSKVVTNLKFYKHNFIKEDLQKHFCIIRCCLVLDPMDLKICSLERNPRL